MPSTANPAPWPGVADHLPPDTTDHLAPGPKVAANPDAVLNKLREQIASGKHDQDAILGAIAIAAQAVTDASGAALGMRRDGVVVCVGRSGETAPALGAKLSSESGISGECLRTGRVLRCDDTEADPRVDAEVCRHLGLRSIAAVPVRSRLETIGILEVFSTCQRAFADGDLAWLGNLAELADAATSQATAVAEAVAATVNTPWPSPTLAAREPEGSRRRVFAVAGGLVVLALLASATWRIWRGNPTRSVPAVAVRSAISETPTPVATPSSETPKTIAENITSSGSERKPPTARVVAASQTEAEEVVVRRLVARGNATQPQVQDPTPSPDVAVVSEPGILDLGTPNPVLPTLERPVSEGATPLVLEQKVAPHYPEAAKASRLEGSVVLQALVSERGRVERVKAVSGNPLLVNAASEAIRRWKYRPAMLNGKPIATETNITVTFKLP